jgi:hypothetical protein
MSRPLESQDPLRSVAGIDVLRCLLAALWRHAGGIGFARLAARTELGALDVVFGQARPAVIELIPAVGQELVHE